MNYTLRQDDDDNITIMMGDRQVGFAIFSHVINEWYIAFSVGVPLNHVETILAEIKKLR
jgi:hypothetical protein